MSKSLDELLPERPDARRHIYAYAIDDTAHASLLKVVDLASVLVEDHLATLFYDRGSDTYADMVLTAIDPHELTNHETIELHADTTREVIA